jgi:hypothetical protein
LGLESMFKNAGDIVERRSETLTVQRGGLAFPRSRASSPTILTTLFRDCIRCGRNI